MRKSNRRSNAKKERIIMIASSGFVLAALTMTGIYMRTQDAEVEDDGYTLDLAELENSSHGYYDLADNADLEENTDELQFADGGHGVEFGNQDNATSDMVNMDDAMDFMPLEVGSGLVKIPGLTDGISESADAGSDKMAGNIESGVKGAEGDVEIHGEIASGETDNQQDAPVDAGSELAANAEEGEDYETQEAVAGNVDVIPTLEFAEADGLLRPVSGEVLIPFSMDGSIYFATLNHYKYNPALMLYAEEGTAVAACAEGVVVSVFEDAQIGTAVTMEIGNGYQITYGQLKDINVSVGDYVSEGRVFATVATPTKYFAVEGSNLYLKVTAEGAPVNPEVLFR